MQPRCLLSLAARFRALQRARRSMRRIVAESVNNGAIMACVGREKGKTVGKRRLAILHENTTKHAFSRYRGIAIVTPLYSYYPLFMNVETYHTPVTSIADSLQHQQHDRFCDMLCRQNSRTSNMTEYNNINVKIKNIAKVFNV